MLSGAAYRLAAALALAALPILCRGGVAVDGRDQARILPPAGARVSAYANAGYRMTLRGGEIRVEVETAPLASKAPFAPPRRSRAALARDPIARLARAQTSGAATRYEAISRILGWVSRHVEYRLDRRQPQDARGVLARRSGYCTGISRLTVAMLGAVGIEAREVAGYVVDDGSPGHAKGYHRWIEAYLPDRGWVFSDPLASHHWVPATYVRLESGELETGGLEGLLLERANHVATVDLHPVSGPGITARRNSPRRLAAALDVRVEGASTGEAELRSASAAYRHTLVDGGATFVGLEPGPYRLSLRLPGEEIVEQSVELPGRVHAGLRVRLGGPRPRASASTPR